MSLMEARSLGGRGIWFSYDWDRESARRLVPADVAPLLLAGVHSIRAQVGLDAEELVVLGEALGAAGRAGLDLPGGQAHREVGDEGVLGLARAVGGHDAPARGLGHAHGLDGLGDGADLVHLEQQRVAVLALDGLLHARGVGDQQVIAHHLAHPQVGELLRVLPVVLVKGVLDGHHGVLLAEGLVHFDHLLARLLFAAVVGLLLEVEVVVLVLRQKLGRCDVHPNLHLAGVARLLDGFVHQIQSLLVGADVGRKAALVAHIARVLAVLALDDALQVVVHLARHLHGLGEGRRADRQDHKLLHRQGVSGVGAAVNDVEAGHGQHQLRVSGQLRNVLVQVDALLGSTGLANRHRGGQDGVGPQTALVFGAVQLNHGVVEARLIGGVLAQQHRPDLVVQEADRLGHALTHPGVTAVAQLHCLVNAGGGARWDDGCEGALVGTDAALDGGVATGVDHLAAENLGDGRRGLLLEELGHKAHRLIRLLLHGGIDGILDHLGQAMLVDVALHAAHGAAR
mmetsp:Transcript_21217/g.37799  ORF Transcript_21217/g.37799 Transcript_21217/m.37799 type:complete len:512 (-) Transcript_21217:122-1657(-)